MPPIKYLSTLFANTTFYYSSTIATALIHPALASFILTEKQHNCLSIYKYHITDIWIKIYKTPNVYLHQTE